MGCKFSNQKTDNDGNPFASAGDAIFEYLIESKQADKFHLITSCLHDNKTFSDFFDSMSIDEVMVSKIANKFQSSKIPSNKLMVRAKAEEKYVYIIESGSVSEVAFTNLYSTSSKKVYEKESVVGDKDFFSDESRKCSYFTSSDSIIHFISKSDWDTTIIALMTRKSIADFPLFSKLSDADLSSLSSAAVVCNYANGDVIIKQGDESCSFYIIASGYVTLSEQDTASKVRFDMNEFSPSFRKSKRSHNLFLYSNNKPLRVGRDHYFGHDSIILGIPHTKTVCADDDVRLFRIDKESFQTLMPSVYETLEVKVRKVLRKKDIVRKSQTVVMEKREVESALVKNDGMVSTLTCNLFA